MIGQQGKKDSRRGIKDGFLDDHNDDDDDDDENYNDDDDDDERRGAEDRALIKLINFSVYPLQSLLQLCWKKGIFEKAFQHYLN